MAGKIRELSDQNFEQEVLQSEGLTLVDFWASWCAPCRALAPVVEELAEQYTGRIQVAKLNVDENPRTAAQYAIRSIPTLLLFKGTQVVKQVIGLQPKGALQKILDENLA
ncbi:MAG: thioredoxin [Candidatus Tectomicrobia bacterium]|uniref:Thioredoxin n=1 Tax=Tectimicrobiota bacterium TaxID=2528274 RepID=A0A932CR76_UNCTE|nr:thioredoxin [Candidatus Tectomicrobia bacterium]